MRVFTVFCAAKFGRLLITTKFLKTWGHELNQAVVRIGPYAMPRENENENEREFKHIVKIH